MKLRQIMTGDVLTLSPGQTASDGLAEMRDAGVKHAVVTSGGDVVGVISERDLGGPHGGPVRRGHSVADLMHRGAVLAEPDMGVAKAALLVRREHIGCLPVVEDGELVGIVTRGDLLEALAFGRKRERTRTNHTDMARPPLVSSPNRDKFP